MYRNCPVLQQNELFRKGEEIYIHKSNSLPEFVGMLHSHDFIEITCVISGECDHIENNESVHLKKGGLCIVNYGVPHANIRRENCPDPFVAYDCAFTPQFIDTALRGHSDFLNIRSSFLFNTLYSSDRMEPHIHLTDNAFGELEQLMKKMFSEFTERKNGYLDLLRAYLIELIIKIFRQMSVEDNHLTKQKYIDLAVRYIEANYAEKITLESIAYRSFFSKTYFGNLFKRETGMCFSDYLQNVRIRHACDMLVTTDLPITSVAEKTGFTDMKSFYAIFKKREGITPKEYRLVARTGQPEAAVPEEEGEKQV